MTQQSKNNNMDEYLRNHTAVKGENFTPKDDYEKQAVEEFKTWGLGEEPAEILYILGGKIAKNLWSLNNLNASPKDKKITILSEEGKDNDLRLSSSRVWIVDPLDGTWEYGQNRRDFAVHIALWDTSQQKLSAGTVDLPAQGITRSVLDTENLPDLGTDGTIRVVASRSRPPKTLNETVARLGEILVEANVSHHKIEIVDVGSVGAKVNEILCGRGDIYLHDTGFFEWDVAAPYIVAEHYGLMASHMSGEPITFNHMPPYVTDLVVSQAELYPHVLQALKETR
jgi:3'(2'), 5'-bisphosphate nucleotidase